MRKQWQLLLVQTESSSIPSSRIARCEARTMSAPDGKDGISNQFSEGVGGGRGGWCSWGDDSLVLKEEFLQRLRLR